MAIWMTSLGAVYGDSHTNHTIHICANLSRVTHIIPLLFWNQRPILFIRRKQQFLISQSVWIHGICVCICSWELLVRIAERQQRREKISRKRKLYYRMCWTNKCATGASIYVASREMWIPRLNTLHTHAHIHTLVLIGTVHAEQYSNNNNNM